MEAIQTMEGYLRGEIESGYMSASYAPLMCRCGCKDFSNVHEFYENFARIEYQVKCNSCGVIVGHWAYGQWAI